MMFEKAAILGLGLLGGSMACAMKEFGLVGSVTGYGRTRSRLDFALEKGIADSVETDPAAAVKDADLVVVSTPVGLMPGIMDAAAANAKPGAVVIDVGSTKQAVVEHAERVLPDGVHFVGCHPMAGSEHAGVEAATSILFENALCVVCASARTEVSALKRVESLWTALKATVVVMAPQEHDLLVAASSHLPHLVAVSLCRAVAQLSGENEKIVPLLAGGFRDTTRIASGSPEMWRDILLQNRAPIAGVLDTFEKIFKDVRERLDAGDPDQLIRMFEGAKSFRDEIPERGRGALESDHRVVVDVEDRPGVLGEITTALGHAGVNIRNINIQHVRDLVGGTLLIVLEKETDIARAVAVLEGLGFGARGV